MFTVSLPRSTHLEPEDWTWFGDFWFDACNGEIRPADQEKVAALIGALRREPTRPVAIEGMGHNRDGGLERQCIAALCDTLLVAGIAPERIVVAETGRPGMRHAQRVEVLIGPA